ncbi:hypothetical protein C5D07_00865 [Rathayibacter tritici]|nr:hypothetical protein C5C06_06140 [Rathayibacter tritici]PPI19921.1 hypothetical protein C5D07_00865 [Rathayibacter tritici]
MTFLAARRPISSLFLSACLTAEIEIFIGLVGLLGGLVIAGLAVVAGAGRDVVGRGARRDGGSTGSGAVGSARCGTVG